MRREEEKKVRRAESRVSRKAGGVRRRAEGRGMRNKRCSTFRTFTVIARSHTLYRHREERSDVAIYRV